jgi:hypothetical protein
VLKAVVQQPDEGHFEVSLRVADWRVATVRVPTQQTALGERHASQRLSAPGEDDMLLQRGYNVCTAKVVENRLGTPQCVSVGLAVAAVANAAVDAFAVRHGALKRSALAAQKMVHVGVLELSELMVLMPYNVNAQRRRHGACCG